MTLDLERLKALAAAATPGPWRNGRDPCHWDSPEVTDGTTFSYYVPEMKDAEYIAALSPATALALIAEVERLRGDVERIATWLESEAEDREHFPSTVNHADATALADAAQAVRSGAWRR